MRFVLVHNHIYKNAGSTVDAILQNAGFRALHLEATAEMPVVHPRHVVEAVRADPSVELVSSHSLYTPRPDDLEEVAFVDITFLRHPVDRLYSIYRYTRHPDVADFPLIPKSASFAQFVDGVAKYEPSHLHSPQTTCFGNGRAFYFPPGRAALTRARETVAATRFLGVVERFDASFGVFVACCEGLLGAKDISRLRGPFEAVNRSAGGAGSLEERLAQISRELGPERYAMVEAANACDLDLYRFAVAELSRRHAAVFGKPLE